jgi:hypothetical protein
MVAHANIGGSQSLVVSERGLPHRDAPGAALDEVPCCLVEEVPRQLPGTPAERAPVDPWLLQRRAALVGSYLAGDSVLVSWSRAREGGPVQVLVGGGSLTNALGSARESEGVHGSNVRRGAPGGEHGREHGRETNPPPQAPGRKGCVANLPAGAVGVEFRGLRGLLEDVPHWAPVAGRLGPVRPAEAGAAGEAWGGAHAARLEEVISTVWPGPFSWLVWATPVHHAEIERMAAVLERLPSFARAQSSANSASATRAERLEARHRELERSRLDGLWNIRVLVGHDSPEQARRLAALLCATVDVGRLPYALHPLAPVPGLGAALDPVGDGVAANRDGWSAERAAGRVAGAAVPAAGWAGGAGDRAATGQAAAGQAAADQAASRAADPAAEHVDGSMWPIVAGTDLLAALAFTPRTELPGIRLRVPSTFDLTPESAGELELGTILSPTRAAVGSLSVSRETLKRHTFVCGATGSGKSQTIRGLLERLSRAEPPVPWLVIEPAKAEYRLMAGRLRDTPHEVVCIRPGDVNGVPVGLNPLEPEPGFALQTHVDLIRALFLASFRSEEPFPQVLTRALTRCYEEQGFDLVLGESRVAGVQPRYPQLADLQRVAREVVTSIGYGPEVTQDVRGFIDVRLSSLRLGTAGRFLGDGHPLDVAGLLARNVVLELEDVGDDQEKAFLMGLVIVRAYEHLRTRSANEPPGEGELRHAMVVEEAHRLLRRPEGLGQVAHAVELFANLLAEVRAYGEGIVVAEQIPQKIVPDVIKNTAVKVIHRLPARDDRDAVGATMNLTDAQSEYIVGLRTGEAAAFSDAMDYPVLVRMECGSARESDESLGDELPLAGRMSVACGACCQAQPCGLRDMRRAQRLLERDPRVTLWVELVVVAHLLGHRAPVAHDALLDDCRRLAQRERECVLAHAVQRAVAARSPAIARHVSPDALAARAVAVLAAQLERSSPPAGPPAAEWLVDPYRWEHVRKSLWDWSEGGTTDASAHPDTALWRSQLALDLPGATCTEQMLALKRRIAGVQELRPTVLFGCDKPSALEWAVGVPRTDERWASALADAVQRFAAHSYEWPAARFAARYVGGGREDGSPVGSAGAVASAGPAGSARPAASASPAGGG